ncbi:PREDICTED: DNA ligase 1-like [Acropora digitifera]|uniref:DNA ligase 1-like n=1 Tax=Acropora digitifera TaxID=70779 RepID=UPI00077AB00F|nr:PREDICTED: DNA ligase 1-like [Acropora digitifera]
MSISMNELQERRRSLQRAPPPKAPRVLPKSETMPKKTPTEDTNGIADFAQLIPGFQLKKTGMRDSLIAKDVDNQHVNKKNEEPETELMKAIRRRKEQVGDIEEETKSNKPKPKPKPKVPRPTPKKRSLSSSSEDSVKEIPPQVNKNSGNGDPHGEPRLRNLPTLESLGKPPVKPVKPEHLVKLLANYSRGDIVIARRRTTLSRSITNSTVIPENNSSFEQEDYDDLSEIKEGIQGSDNVFPENGLRHETRDNTFPANGDKAKEPREEEGTWKCYKVCLHTSKYGNNFFVDFKTESAEKFGEEVYEAVGSKTEGNKSGDDGFDSPVESKFSSSATPPSAQAKEKANKSMSKKELEQQKKREREEQKKKKDEEKRREREEREEKRRKEEEKRKRERDDKDLRKKHKLKPGVEGSGIGEAKSNFRGDGKHELPVKEGEVLTIMCEDGCPSGKCLVKNNEGHLGYVPKEIITRQISSQENGDSEIKTECEVFHFNCACQFGISGDDSSE